MRKLFRTFVAFAAIGAICFNVHASSISELQEQKEQQEGKKAEAEATVDKLKNQQSDILTAIAELDNKVNEYNEQIAELESQKKDLEADIETTKAELKAAQEDEQKQYSAMKERIRYSYENGNVEYFDTVFSSADMSDIINKSEYVEQIYEYDSNMLNDLIKIENKINNTQDKLESELEDVQQIEQEVSENKEAIEILIEGKQQQAANYQTSIDEYQAQVAQLEADIAATNDAIAAAEAAAEAARKAAEEAARKAAEAANQEYIPSSTEIYYTGGTFQWPVATGGYVSSVYGPRWGRMHQGIDIACATGTPIVAGETGVVISAAYSSSMGYYIVLDHGGGVTTVYMHNSSFAVSAGETVSRGQVIAYAGSTGNSTGPHCHFGVRINGTYVDPAPYL